jgi:hypothetical protein
MLLCVLLISVTLRWTTAADRPDGVRTVSKQVAIDSLIN